jgi:NTP pyrophosphatase (non-canonical NTP hydrolase)
MKIDLPEIDWDKQGWSAASQLKKIAEEFGEVAEAVALQDHTNIIRESLDTIQTCWTLITMIRDEWQIDMDKFYREHEEKLTRKGYLKDEGDPYAGHEEVE